MRYSRTASARFSPSAVCSLTEMCPSTLTLTSSSISNNSKIFPRMLADSSEKSLADSAKYKPGRAFGDTDSTSLLNGPDEIFSSSISTGITQQPSPYFVARPFILKQPGGQPAAFTRNSKTATHLFRSVPSCSPIWQCPSNNTFVVLSDFTKLASFGNASACAASPSHTVVTPLEKGMRNCATSWCKPVMKPENSISMGFGRSSLGLEGELDTLASAGFEDCTITSNFFMSCSAFFALSCCSFNLASHFSRSVTDAITSASLSSVPATSNSNFVSLFTTTSI
mmetsp:Transcript_90675/g.143321  ORF Transcript_90675/g.143321 Transcript_90675/m.143321 type:complete len:282 (+) Transcript_90675:158-1003(+)